MLAPPSTSPPGIQNNSKFQILSMPSSGSTRTAKKGYVLVFEIAAGPD